MVANFDNIIIFSNEKMLLRKIFNQKKLQKIGVVYGLLLYLGIHKF